jgi:leader peptidase (prepilin peptidase)/N-methyltransferase
VNAADAVTVAVAAAAGLLAGRVTSRPTARLPGAARSCGLRLRGPGSARPGSARPGSAGPGTGSRRYRLALSLATGLACAVLALRFGPAPALPAFCYLAAIAVPLAEIDTSCRRLPDSLTLPSYPVALALLGAAALLQPGGGQHLVTALCGMTLALAFFLIQVIAYPAGLGWGDVKLSGVLGLYLGWLGPGALVTGLFLGYLIAAAAGLALMASRRATRKSRIAFGPFLLGGTLAAVLLMARGR